jgi:tetratricopeptide (TPR) repeat protein
LMNKAVEPAVAAVTLIGGARTLQHAQALLDQVLKDLPVQPHHPTTVLELLRDLYAGSRGTDGRYIEPLQPDLLGEELVAEALSQDKGFLGRVLDGANSEEAYSTLTVLTRLAQRRPELDIWLETALHDRLEALAEIALDVAVETGDPLGFKLAEEIESLGSIEVIQRIQERCDSDSYQRSLPLREVARVATERGLELLRDSKIDLDEETQSEYARLASNLGLRFSALGRREDALNATQESVEIRRQLALRRPADFLPALAASLNNLGTVLTELGRREDALNATQEAVEIYRQLALQSPDVFLHDLAMSINNLGIMLSEFGRCEDALDSTQEALKIYRQLALRRPDAFLPELAMSLNNLGNRLSELGRREDALNATQEAVEIKRQLALRRPDAFLPDLAMSLSNLGPLLSKIGRREDALNAAQEAVEIRRQLALQRPDAFLPDLAISLNNLGAALRKLERREDAVQVIEEAIQILSPFFLRLPLAFGAWMTKMVGNYLKSVEAAGQDPREELLNPILEALNSLAQEQAPEP